MAVSCRHHGRVALLLGVLLLATSLSSSCALSIPRQQHHARRLSAGKKPLSSLKMSDVAAAVPAGGAQDDEGTATIPNEVFNLVKSIVGAGVLSLPAGIAAFGDAPSALIPATALIALIGGISAYTFSLIGRVCAATDTSSYSDAWDVTVGKSTSALIAFSCFIDCFAGNLSYSMILADTFQALASGMGFALTRTQSLLGITSLVLLPLCFLKNLSSLAPFSLVGIAGMLYTTVAMAIRYFGGTYALPNGKFLDSVMALPVFGTKGASSAMTPKSLILMCMLSNAYIAHFNAPKFFYELKNRTLGRFNQVVGWSFGASVVLYSIISGLGFLTFGAASNGLILNNYSTKDLLMGFSRIAVALSVIGSYPLIFVGARDGILDFFKVSSDKRTTSNLNKVTVGLMGIVTLLAAKLTDLGLVASVGGATFGTALVFVYPTIMFMRLMKQKGTKTNESKLAGLIAVMGVIMGSIGTTMALKGVEV